MIWLSRKRAKLSQISAALVSLWLWVHSSSVIRFSSAEGFDSSEAATKVGQLLHNIVLWHRQTAASECMFSRLNHIDFEDIRKDTATG